jgi:hypothetical protein
MRFPTAALLAALILPAFSAGGIAGETPSPTGANVYFISPADGDTVTSPVTVRFGLVGMGVAPAGVEKAETGHHHLFIDTELKPDELDDAIAADDNHRHFGGGQTETTVALTPGKHTLQLVLGDMNHIPHNPPVTSPVISITVE